MGFLLLGIQSLYINLSVDPSHAQISLCGQGCSSETSKFMNIKHPDVNSALLIVVPNTVLARALANHSARKQGLQKQTWR